MEAAASAAGMPGSGSGSGHVEWISTLAGTAASCLRLGRQSKRASGDTPMKSKSTIVYSDWHKEISRCPLLYGLWGPC